MEIAVHDAISPVDGRYRKVTELLTPYFSEAGLIRYRVRVEAAYLVALCKIPLPPLKDLSPAVLKTLEALTADATSVDIKAVKNLESVTNHDVKAVEYYIKEVYGESLGTALEFVHFGLTSQDINNTAIPWSVNDAMRYVMMPVLKDLRNRLSQCAEEWRDISMLARTHGQPASPTSLGKEIAVFVDRINGQLRLLETIPHAAKFGGATGNFNAHYAAYPDIDWVKFANEFVAGFGLVRSQITTQIEHYDHLAALFDNLARINTILIDFSRDLWQYISMNYFSQQVKKGEVGSSAMPHKVNPIDFENAEGNLGMANAIFHHLSTKLPVSRLQRDLTDSTVLRNTGVPFAHTLIAIRSLLRGMEKISVNKKAIESDLDDNWAVVAEGIQTILRREGYPNPYEALKDLTRTGDKITAETIRQFIGSLKVSDAVKKELLSLSPSTYTGMAKRF